MRAAANPAIALRLQSNALAGRVAELFSLCGGGASLGGVDHLDDMLNEVAEHLRHAHESYVVWVYLTGDSMGGRQNAALNKYPRFFDASIHAHFVGMLMALSRVFDDDANARSLLNTINSLRKGPLVPEAVRQDAGRQLKSGRKIWEKKASVLRHKAFAHPDKAYTVERAFEEAEITGDEFRIMIDSALEAVNTLFVQLDFVPTVLDQGVEDETTRLLGELSKDAGGSA